MAETEFKECIDVPIPKDAVEIKVTNIINPYFIRIHEVIDNRTKKSNLCRLLNKIVKKQNEKKYFLFYKPKVGDDVIVSNHDINNEIDLPDWACRGVVIDCTPKTSDVFLVDYGITVNVPTKSLVKYSPSQISNETMTETVGIYNIIPVDSNQCIVKQWPNSTVNFIKELFQVSKKIYFDVLACDNQKKKYGDFYLVIEKKNICLSKILTHGFLAAPFCKELKLAIKNDCKEQKISVSYQLGEGKITTNGIIKKQDVETSQQSHQILKSEKRKIVLKKKHMNREKMLIQSEYSCEPLEFLADARFTAVVHKALENNGVRAPKQIQSYMWPAVKKGLNTVVISPKESGKTIGYLVPVISCITAHEETLLEKQKEGGVSQPIVLILCASVNECINVTTRCKEILYDYDPVKAFAAFNGLTDKFLLTNIYNKFDILVSTPPFLVRLLEKYPGKINFSQLSCLILDHADDLLEKYSSELSTLIQNYKIIDNKRKNLVHDGPMQIITASECWTEKLRLFIEIFKEKPYICIGSFTEAAAFCNVKGRMMICHSDNKNQKVLDIIDDYKEKKTMVFCINSEEANNLNDFLVQKSIKTVLVHEKMPVTKIGEIKGDWNKCVSGMYPLVICTDEVGFELEISNIEFLIHYTVTNVSKTAFNRRFSVLMDNWIQESKSKCRVLILFDETKENVHFKGVVNILKRLKVDLPTDWQEIADGLDLANDIKKKNYPICDYIKLFGRCKELSCPDRHRVMADVDVPISTNFSIGDELKLHIIYVNSASHFSVRVLDYTRTCEETGKKTVTPFTYTIIQFQNQMKSFYSKAANRVMERNIVVGKICALRTVERFSRVQILRIVEKNRLNDKPKIVKVRCIDDGKLYEKTYVHDLYEIPQNLLDYKFPIFEVYLTGIAPFDEETKWTDIASKEAQNWFSQFCNATSLAYAKVLLQIGNCIWTDTIVARSKLIGYPDLVASSLKDYILKNEHGTKNENHLANLIDLCRSGGLTEMNGKSIELPDESVAPIDDCD